MHSLSRDIRRVTFLALAGLTVAAVNEPDPHEGSGPTRANAEPAVSVHSGTAPAAALRITGRVVDAATNAPLQGVQVILVDAGRGALTNAQGRYLILLPDGLARAEELEVRVAVLGYHSQSAAVRPADASADGTVTLDFQLQAAALSLDALVVTGASAAESRAYVVGRPAAPFVDGDPRHDREQYAYIDENDFRSASDNPLSTFSIDVDRASHSNVRRFLLTEHRLPPVDAVQVEEMVNYFPYDYALPTDGEPLAVTTELGRAPWREEHRLLRIGLASPAIETADLPPSNLVFLLDVSGSMQAAKKLPLVKRSLRLLVDQLRDEDRVALAVYAGAAGLVLEPTSGAHKDRIMEAIDRLEAGGSTAGGAGLRLAYDVARRHFVEGGNNRVILATDGDFNVGESSDAAMTRLVEERREEGTFLTILGFGTGNLQNTKMQEMAQNGNGNYAYIDGLDEARKVLVGEMGGTLLTVAKDVKIQVEFNPARVRSYRLIGYENRLLANEDFNDDQKDAGELGAGHTVTALYEIVPVGSASDVDTPDVDALRYQSAPRTVAASDGDEIAFVKVRYKDPDGTESRLLEHPVQDQGDGSPSADFRFASAVAGFGMLLRDSEYVGTLTGDRVLRLARSGLGEDPGGYRRDFLQMIEAYRSLTEATEEDGSQR